MSEPRASLVTGGCGFLGRFLVDALVRRGDRVTVLDHRVDRWRDDVDFVQGDICDPELVARACAGQSVVFHNASLVHTKHSRVEQVRAVNIDGTRNVLAACRKGQVPKLVYVSSASVVYEGEDIERGDERLPYARKWLAPYAETKRIAEEEVLQASGQGGVLTCAIRPHMIFGPGDTRLLPAILARAKAGNLKFTVGAGDRLNDFTYVSNIVDSLLLADERLQPGSPVSGRAYFITNGEPMNFWDFVRRVLVGLGYPTPRFRIPYAVAYAAAAARETFDTVVRGGTLHAEEGLSRFSIRYICTHHYFSYARATADLGYTPQVPMLEGIRRTVEYFRAQGMAAV